MSDKTEQIIEILNKAENELQQVIVQSAERRDYRSVEIARSAAVGVQSIRLQVLNPTGRSEVKAGKAERRTKRQASMRSRRRKGYPKFQVKGQTLVRIGWSKKQHAEYTHKTPKSVFEVTIRAMAGLAQSGAGPFAAEQLIEKIDIMESEAIPSYQVYSVIGLLRVTKCIKQIGREGYNIPVEVVEKAKEKWSDLSKQEM